MQAKANQIELLKKDIKERIKVVLLFGFDLGLIKDLSLKISKIITNINDDFNVSRINKEQLKESQYLLLEEGNVLSFLGDRKVILLQEADNDCTEAVRLFYENIKTDTVLIINAYNLTKKGILYNYCLPQKDILVIGCYQETEKEIEQLIIDNLKYSGYTFNEDVIYSLKQRLGGGRINIASELEKLKIFLGQQTHITVQDVEQVVTDTNDAGYDDFCKALAGGDEKTVDKLLEYFLHVGDNPVTILRVMIGYFFQLCEGAFLKAQGVNIENISQKILRANQFNLKTAYKFHLQRWSKENVTRALELLLEAEIQIKSGTIPQELTLERYCTTLAHTGKRICQ